MKLTDKRIWKFEAAMLLCGVATVCVEALNYGISLFYLIGQLLIYPLCFCIGGVATWKVSKTGKVWQLIGYSMLFSFITYNLLCHSPLSHIRDSFCFFCVFVVGWLLCVVLGFTSSDLLLCV